MPERCGVAGVQQSVECRTVVGIESVSDSCAHPLEHERRVLDGPVGGGIQVDVDAAFLEHLESGAVQVLGPVRMLVPSVARGECVAPGFEPGAAESDVVGEEPRKAVHLHRGEQPTGRERRPCRPEQSIRIGDVVQRQCRPDQVDVADVRPPVVEIGLHRPDARCRTGFGGRVPHALEHARIVVDGDEFGIDEPPGERDGSGARPGSDVDDRARRTVQRRGDQLDDVVESGAVHDGIEIEDLRLPEVMVVIVLMTVSVHGSTVERFMLISHTLLPMEQEDGGMDRLVRQRIRGLRQARGWTLDALAARCHISPSNLSRIETGRRRIALDQLVPIARALGTTLDELIASDADDDVVIRPQPDTSPGLTTWLLSRERSVSGVTVAKMRFTDVDPRPTDDLNVHPGHEWFTVLTGIARLQLGDRTIVIHEGNAAEFPTMTPHAISGVDGPVEILTIFDHNGERAHLRDTHDR